MATAKTPPPSALIYVRQSSDRKGEGMAVARQREDCQRLCHDRGWTIKQVIEDNDTSARTSGKRPGFTELVESVQRDESRIVVAWNLDRLTRNRADTLTLVEVGMSHNVTVALVRGPELDMSTPAGRMMADFMGGMARYEIDQKGDRQRRANRQRAEKGLPHIARRAFGYEADGLTVRESEAELLVDMANKFLGGWSYRDITYWLNKSGYRTTTGSQFTIKAVKDHLSSNRNAGFREYEGVEYPGVWPAIYKEETHRRIKLEIKRRSEPLNGSRSPNAKRYLLTGLLYCGRCGQPMVGHQRRAKPHLEPEPKYECREHDEYEKDHACGKLTRIAAPLEHLIREAIIYRLDTPDLAKLIEGRRQDEAEIQRLLNQQETLTNQLEELLDSYADQTLSKREYARAKQRVAAKLDHVNGSLMSFYQSETVTAILSAGSTVRDAWSGQTNGWRRKLIEVLVEKVVIMPSRKLPNYFVDGRRFRFDMDAVRVDWRA